MATMNKFIELTQPEDDFIGFKGRKIKVNIAHIDFYGDKHIVFSKRAIDVLESYDEITKLIEK